MTDQQLPLSGFGPVPEATDRLFFAVFPDIGAARQIAKRANGLRAECRLIGQPLKEERFHVTLHFLGDHAGLPASLIEAASTAAATVDTQPFEVTFDRAGSFKRGPANRPVVLLGSDGVVQLTAFQESLGRAMTDSGLERWVTMDFTPHVTLLYDRRGISEQPAEPVSWTVNELALVHSVRGQTRQEVLGRWPLRG